MRTFGLSLVSVALGLTAANAQISVRYTYPRAPSYSRASRSYGAGGLYPRQTSSDTCAYLDETPLIIDDDGTEDNYGNISQLHFGPSSVSQADPMTL